MEKWSNGLFTNVYVVTPAKARIQSACYNPRKYQDNKHVLKNLISEILFVHLEQNSFS